MLRFCITTKSNNAILFQLHGKTCFLEIFSEVLSKMFFRSPLDNYTSVQGNVQYGHSLKCVVFQVALLQGI